jgi:hypothetical protein
VFPSLGEKSGLDIVLERDEQQDILRNKKIEKHAAGFLGRYYSLNGILAEMNKKTS